MPISRDILFPRQPEAGKIKIGRKGAERQKGSGKGTYRLPEKLENDGLPYFLVTTTIREGKGTKDDNYEVDKEVMSRLPHDSDGFCRRIPFMLKSDLIEENFQTALISFINDELSCINTEGGKAATRYEFVDRRRVATTVKCPCERLNARNDPKCKPNGTLWLTIVAGDEAEFGALHSFRTVGWNSISGIEAALKVIQEIVGTIAGIKLWLVVKPVMKKDRDRVWRRIPVVSVRFLTRDILSAQKHVIETVKRRHLVMQMAGMPIPLGLPAPGIGETPEQHAEIAAEFYPTGQDSEDGDAEQDEGIGDFYDVDFDPETGEVIEQGPVSRAEQGRTEAPIADGRTHLPVVRGEPVTAGALPEARSAEVVEPDPSATQPKSAAQPKAASKPTGQEYLPKDHAMMLKIGADLGDLATIRGYERSYPEAFKAGLKSVLEQISQEYCGVALPFNTITRKHAEMIISGLERELRHAAECEEGPDDESPPPPDNEIPLDDPPGDGA